MPGYPCCCGGTSSSESSSSAPPCCGLCEQRDPDCVTNFSMTFDDGFVTITWTQTGASYYKNVLLPCGVIVIPVNRSLGGGSPVASTVEYTNQGNVLDGSIRYDDGFGQSLADVDAGCSGTLNINKFQIVGSFDLAGAVCPSASGSALYL